MTSPEEEPNLSPPRDAVSRDSWSRGQDMTHLCPPLSELEAHVKGALSTQISRHLEKCVECRTRAIDLRENARFATHVREILGSPQTGGVPLEQTQPAPRSDTNRAALGAIPPDLVSGYTLLEELHRGGQGIVYRATQSGTKREVAIKMLLAGTFSTDKQRQRFELEAEIAAQLRHPAIVTVHEIVPLEGGRYALVMELVQGVRINQHQFEGPTHKERRDRLLQVFVSVCDAVSHAHRAGVIHRDLKPSNILIDTSGAPRLLDFGIARRMTTKSGDAQLTLTGDSAWTLAYASPEQLENPRSVDVRSDIYSLGVLIYELLSGKPPYETQDVPLSLAIARVRTQPPAPLRLLEALGGGSAARDLEAVVMHALEKDTSRRYQSVEALAEDLTRLLRGQAVLAPKLGMLYRTRKAVRQRWKTLLVFAAALLLLGAGLYAWADQRARTEAASQQTASEAANAEGVRLLLYQLIGPMQVSMSANGDTPNDPPTPQRQAIERLEMKLDLGHLKDKPQVDASVRALMAEIYESHDLFAEAEHQYRESLRLLRRAHRESLIADRVFDSIRVSRQLDLARTLFRLNRMQQSRELCEAVLVEPAAIPVDALTAHTLLARLALADEESAESLESARAHATNARMQWKRAGSPLLHEASIFEVESRIAKRDNALDEARSLANLALYARMRTGTDEDPQGFETLRLAASYDFKEGERSAARITLDHLDRGYLLNTDYVMQAYWNLARAQIKDPATNDYISFYNIHVTRGMPIQSMLLARDGMHTISRDWSSRVWMRLGESPIEYRDERMSLALKITDWAVRDGDIAQADRWIRYALESMRERSTDLDPDTRLPATALRAADIALCLSNLDRARTLLDEAVKLEARLCGKSGDVEAQSRILRAVMTAVEANTPLSLPAADSLTTSITKSAEYRFLHTLEQALAWSPSDVRPVEEDLEAIRQGAQRLATSQTHRTLASQTIERLRTNTSGSRNPPQQSLAYQLEAVLRRSSIPPTLEAQFPIDQLPP
jgi:hypothetical protein